MDELEYMSERIEYLEKLVKKYKFDYLTGLMGKLDFNEKFYRLFEECMFSNINFTLVICDIDGLHNVNRTKGYAEGDVLIKKVADDLKEKFQFHQIYRISGDEFCVIVRESSESYDEVVNKISTIEDITFFAEKSKGFKNPIKMFKETDKKLSIKKKERKLAKRV